MADTAFPLFNEHYSGTVPNIKLVDNGDGTYAVSISGTLTVGQSVSSTIATAQVACSGTQALLFAANAADIFREVKNTHASVALYIGATGVATTTGHYVGPGESFVMEDFTGALYGITGGTAVTATTVKW